MSVPKTKNLKPSPGELQNPDLSRQARLATRDLNHDGTTGTTTNSRDFPSCSLCRRGSFWAHLAVGNQG
ncbi:MAG: hypothetical protein KDA44_17565, partial [Planctomycetales bacterium]|nr:hypothetical protein [Planctomycetales bacterium]